MPTIREIQIRHLNRLLKNEIVKPEIKMTDCPFTFDNQQRQLDFYYHLLSLKKIKSEQVIFKI